MEIGKFELMLDDVRLFIKEVKIIKMLFIIVVVFFVCWIFLVCFDFFEVIYGVYFFL